MLIYGQAKYFNGGAYVVGAGAAGRNTNGANNAYQGTPGNNSTFTLTSTYDSQVYTTATGNVDTGSGSDDTTTGRVLRYLPPEEEVIDLTNLTPNYTITSQIKYSVISDKGLPTGVSFRFTPIQRWYNITGTPYSIFGGGQGGSMYNSINAPGVSMFAGAGGAIGTNTGSNGTAPGGGGGGVTATNGTGGTGAQGSVRIYHV